MGILHGVVGFILGGAVGSAVTYYILNKKIKKEYEIKMTEELTQYKHDFKINEYEKHLEKMDEADKEYAEYRKKKEEEYKNSPDPRENNKVIDTHKVNYTKTNTENEEEETPMSDFVEFVDTVPMEERNPKPYIIKEEEHYAGPKYYDFEEYTYILPNEDVIDDDDNVLTEVEKILGYKNLEELNNCKDGDYIYIRNEIYECDYCITLADWRDKI